MSESASPLVVICRRLMPAGTILLREAGVRLRQGGLDVDAAELQALVFGAEAIIADPTVPVDAALLDAAGPGLRVVANFAVGYDNVDLKASRDRGVAVTNTPDVLTNATAELALELTLAAARRTTEAEAALRDGHWRGWDPGAMLGLELSGACIGIIGLGRIGTRYAELVRPLAAEIVYTARSAKPGAEVRLGARRVPLEELLESSDVVSLHAPASADTEHLIARAELDRMRDHAVLVNTARGSLVDTTALINALAAGKIGAAGLDVYEQEPDVPHGLLHAPRCVLRPHIGSATHTARDAMAALAARNALVALTGEEPPNRVA